MLCDEFDIMLLALSEMRKWADPEDVAYLLRSGGRPGFSAAVMPVGMKRLIIYNDAHSFLRQRSDICHELSHCFLGHPVTAPLTDEGERNYHSEVEREAAFMGGLLLMPNEAAHHVSRSGMSDAAAISYYEVSLDMLTFRMRMSGARKAARRRAEKALAE